VRDYASGARRGGKAPLSAIMRRGRTAFVPFAALWLLPACPACQTDGVAPGGPGGTDAGVGLTGGGGFSAGTGGSGTAGAPAAGGGTGVPNANGGSGAAAGGRSSAADAAAGETDACDGTHKRCGGFCVTPRPAVGCSLTGCDPCPDVPYGRAICVGERCSFACNSGAPTATGACLPGEGGVDVSCSNNLEDGAETDIDCGGSTCPPCPLGKHCSVASDCEGMECNAATGLCSCTPLTCADVSGTCGTLSDGCGHQITCAGSCSSLDKCFNGRCCTPRTTAECGALSCGSSDDGCGGTVDCGGCTPPAVCGLVFVNQCGSASTGCGTDSDFDGIDDCTEDGDGDPWTDKNVFNGVSARLSDACSTLLGNDCSLNRINTLSLVNACVNSKTAVESRNQFSGWDFTTTDDQSCNPGYGAQPTWTVCRNRFAIEAKARVDLKTDGTYCFAIDGETKAQCAAFFFDGETTALESGSAARCYTTTAGEHTVHWLYTVGSNAGNRRFRLLFCQGTSCTPTTVLPSSMLRLP
jgi:hypothetical protein